jgi:hypothetical protein
MNFPVGTVITKAPLPINFTTVAEKFESIGFNGYIIQSVKGQCIEEGVLFFRDGKMSACIVECLSLKQTYKGDEAISYFFNQTKGEGFFQSVELSRSQIDLVTAFDQKILLSNKISLKDLAKLIPSKFRENFELSDEKTDLLTSLGLGELKK